MSKKRTVIASKIKWDTDGAKVKLPKKIEVKLPDDMTDEDEISDYVSDKISDETGFCHKGFKLNIDKK